MKLQALYLAILATRAFALPAEKRQYTVIEYVTETATPTPAPAVSVVTKYVTITEGQDTAATTANNNQVAPVTVTVTAGQSSSTTTPTPVASSSVSTAAPVAAPQTATSETAAAAAAATSAPSSADQPSLAAHNAARAQYGASPLTWSDTLAAYAQQHASSCVFAHTGGPYGENLAMGYSSPDASVQAWMAEEPYYQGGFSEASGHFSQVVWKGSSQLGCAWISCSGGMYLMCEYDAPGNVAGEYAQNVQT